MVPTMSDPAVPLRITYPGDLPVSQRRDDIAAAIRDHQVVVVAGETYVLGGDIIVSVEGEKISSIEELRDVIASHAPGDKVTLVIYRDAKKTSVTVTLGRRPASPQG